MVATIGIGYAMVFLSDSFHYSICIGSRKDCKSKPGRHKGGYGDPSPVIFIDKKKTWQGLQRRSSFLL